MQRKKIIVSLLLIGSGALFADSYSYDSNAGYAESGRLRANQKILRISYHPTKERYTKEITNRTYDISWTLIFHLGSKTGKEMPCRLTDRKIERCSIVPLGTGGYDWAGTTDFVLRKETDGWYEINIDPTSDETAWFQPVTTQELSFTTISVKEWVASQDGFKVVGASVPVLESKNETSEHKVDCGSTNGFAERSSGLLPLGPPDGDWIPVTCLAPGCYEERDPSLKFAEEVEGDQEKKKLMVLPKCPSGWIRWKKEDGTLNVVPEKSFPDC
jgi:hypothetical protein